MKIRSGFVSNSSSSSFVIVGIDVPYNLNKKVIEKAKAISEPELVETLVCDKCGCKPFNHYRWPGFPEAGKFCMDCGGNLVEKLTEDEQAYTISWAFDKLSLSYYKSADDWVAGIEITGKNPEQAIIAQKEVTKILHENFPEEKFEIKVFGGEYKR